MKRPPIVVVVGSVDHGKTSLLDTIRKTNTAAREAGSITQAIAAYEIEHAGERITFIDTPGHEAFLAMRARGATIADMAILAVAADDGVKPQTIESIKILRETKTPFVVAITKIDRVSPTDIERVKQELAAHEVALEGMGGSVSFQALSSKTGEGIPELLDFLLLTAAVEELSYDPAAGGEAVILEAHRDSRRGVSVSAIVHEGTIREGDDIATPTARGKIKILESFTGARIREAAPSLPIHIIGLEELPCIGEVLFAGTHAADILPITPRAPAPPPSPVGEKPSGESVNIILTADAAGSLEALSQVVRSLHRDETARPDKTTPSIRIVAESIGDITDGDVKRAISTNASIIGFRVEATKAAEGLARTHHIRVITSDIIYDLIKTIEETFSKLGEKIHAGVLEILRSFGTKENKQIIGGAVREGMIRTGSTVGVERKGRIIGTLKIVNLQKAHVNALTIEAGNECGILAESAVEIKPGDLLIAD